MNSKYLLAVTLLSSNFILANSVQADGHAEKSGEAHSHIIVEELATDLKNPWGLAFLPNGDALITEKSGGLRKLSADGTLSEAISGLPDYEVKGQGGMLGLAVHPDFSSNKKVYVCLNVAGDGGWGSEVHVGELNGNALSNVEPVFVALPKAESSHHFGCRVSFDNDNKLFVGLGDRGGFKEKAQDITTHFGKVIRLNDDGSIPQDNPFVGKEGKDDIFSYGHRNVQGMTKHPVSGEIWTHEHGPKGGDEINILSAGDNYGWPSITYGVNYNGSIITDKTEMEGMRQPLLHWTPSIAPSGMTFYTGDMFADWKGHLLVGSLKFRHLRLVKLDDNNQVIEQVEILKDREDRIRDVVQAPDGSVYLLVDHVKGKVLRLSAGK